MTAPIKFLQWVLGIAFMVGLADGFGHLTFQMAKAAMHAQQLDQLSWGKYSRSLWSNHQVGGKKISE
jgi:hypothetical protein